MRVLVNQAVQLMPTARETWFAMVHISANNLVVLDYGSGSVAHFGKDSGLGGCGIDLNQAVDHGSIAWTGAGTWTPESQDTICVDFYGDDNQNYCCQLGQALTSADGFKPLSNCNPV